MQSQLPQLSQTISFAQRTTGGIHRDAGAPFVDAGDDPPAGVAVIAQVRRVQDTDGDGARQGR